MTENFEFFKLPNAISLRDWTKQAIRTSTLKYNMNSMLTMRRRRGVHLEGPV